MSNASVKSMNKRQIIVVYHTVEILESSELSTPVNTEHLYNIYTMLGQRRRRWADVV